MDVSRRDFIRLGTTAAAAGGTLTAQATQAQSKGRIERLWRTLQDRLVSELRLRGIATREAANAFLPEFLADFNHRFAHPPAETLAAWRRPPRDFADVLSCRYARLVARDNTVRLGARWLQIPRGPHGRSSARCRVELRECLDGRLVVLHDGVRLTSEPAPGPDFVLTPRRAPSGDRIRRLRASRIASEGGGRSLGMAGNRRSAARPAPAPPAVTQPHRPAPTHPWRRSVTRRGRALQATWKG